MENNNQELLSEEDKYADFNSDADLAGTTHLQEELDETQYQILEKEIAEWKDKYTRLVADFENYKKRSFKEKLDTIQTASRDVIQQLLDVLDDCDRAEKQFETPQEVATLQDGIKLIFNKLRTTLQAKGLKPLESKNQPFDVELHEAVTEIPAPTAEQVGNVIDELQKGYFLNEKLIRHAKVVVGK